MPTFSAFATDDRATSIGDLIALKPTSITIKRGSSTLGAQTVRLETLASQRMVVGEGGVTHACDAYLLGTLNHPTSPDCDVQAGDRFAVGTVFYECVIVLPAHTEGRQCYLKVRA